MLHIVPLGQQWIPSEQHWPYKHIQKKTQTFGKGQQANGSSDVLLVSQHVSSAEQ